MRELSVVVPYYNESKVIKHTFKSLINQSYKPYEIIFINSSSTDSSFDIIETQYKCTLRANEFNYSLNPTLKVNAYNSGSEEYKSFVTEDTFSPFVTSVGLYNEDQELVAVGKLSQPLPTSQTTDTTIFINIDR